MMKADAMRAFALSLPEAEERETWGEATFRVRNKIFVILDSDGKRASIKATHEEQQASIEENAAAYFLPAYVAQHGWIGVNLANARTGEVRELIEEAWRLTAPKRLVKTFDERVDD
jgi:hypothetical protein